MTATGRFPVIGVDIGGTTTTAHLIPAPGAADHEPGSRDHPDHLPPTGASIVAGLARPTDASGPASVVATVAAVVDGLLASAGLSLPQIAAVGVGIPGHVDPEAGTVRHAVNLGIDGHRFAFRSALEASLGVPVAVDNDVRTAALGAYGHLRATRSPELRSLVYLGIGTGIAAGAIVDGRLLRGRHDAAGEIGHVPMVAGGPPCRCGMAGCLEAVAAGPVVARAWPRGASDLFERAGRGEPEAVDVAEGFARSLAPAVMWLMAAYDPDLVVLGGGVGAASPAVATFVAGALRSLAAGSELAAQVFAGGRLESLDLGLPVGALGAASLALELVSVPSGPRPTEQAIQEEDHP